MDITLIKNKVTVINKSEYTEDEYPIFYALQTVIYHSFKLYYKIGENKNGISEFRVTRG